MLVHSASYASPAQIQQTKQLQAALQRKSSAWFFQSLPCASAAPNRFYAAEFANSIGSTIEGSSFSGLLTRVENGHIRIGFAGKGLIRSRSLQRFTLSQMSRVVAALLF
jgi:hypothetical protein